MIKYWRLSLLRKCGVLIGVSVGVLALSWLAHFMIQGKVVLDSSTSIIGSLIFPTLVSSFGSGGNTTCPVNERTAPDDVAVWLLFLVYLILLSGALYFQILPADKWAFVVPLGYGLIMLPVELWHQTRVKRLHAANDTD